MILDTSYTLKMFRERKMEQALESRKLGGYFGSVISVHPLAGLFEPDDERFGAPVITRLDESHVFVEGRIGLRRMWRFAPPLNFLLAQITLVRLLLAMARAAKVDLIRIGDPYYLGLLGLLLARLLRVPLAIRVGGRYDEIVRVTGKPMMPRLFRFRWIEKYIERFVFPRCALVAGANEDNMRYAIENGACPDTTTIFRYGNLVHGNHWRDPNTREGAEEALAEYGLEDNTFVVTVTRLEPVKRTEDVIRMMAELLRRGHLVKCLIVGDGRLRADLEHLATSLGVGDAVVFAGNRTQEWLSVVLPKAAAVISPQMGRALTEAALAGVPIVAYDFDWHSEIVVNGQTGYLVTNNDWMALADKTELILTHPESGKEMGKNARTRALEMMNSERLERHEQDEYSKMFARFSEAHASE